MFYHVQSLINEIVADEPDPSAANALQEGLGGQFGEMRTMMQYLFQSFNFRGCGTIPGPNPRYWDRRNQSRRINFQDHLNTAGRIT